MKIITVGRGSGNDININDPFVSQSHCQIIQDDYGQYRLVDANSKNGTFVNGIQRHGEVRLNKSDIIRIGNTTLPWLSYFAGGGTTGGGGTYTSSYTPSFTPYTPPQPPMSKPDNFLVWSILATIFCCIPFGIVAIVKSSKVDKLWYSGDYEGAQDAANSARTWFWWSFGLGLFVLIVYFIIQVCLIAAL